MLLQTLRSTATSTDGATITDPEAAALARATVNLFRAWGLTDAAACTLLGAHGFAHLGALERQSDGAD